MRTINDLTNLKFGYLTALEPAKRHGDGHIKWKCLCVCGKNCIVASNDLRRGQIQSCGCKRKEIRKQNLTNKQCSPKYDLVNVTFGKLTVIKYEALLGKWFCSCVCGNFKYVRTNGLISGHVKSCGCVKIIYEEREQKIKKGLYCKLIKRDKRVSVSVNEDELISFDQFSNIISLPCYYCGVVGSHTSKDIISLKTKEPISDATVKHNGIDRINNNKGYTFDNCVSCCYKCNTAKMDWSYEDHLFWINKTYNHLKEKGKL